MALSLREKVLITLLLLLLAAAGLFYGWRQVQNHQLLLEQSIARQKSVWVRANVLRSQIAQLNSAPSTAPSGQPLIARLERLAGQINLKDRIQLNVVPQTPGAKLESVEMKLDRLDLDDMINLVYTLENARPTLVVEQFELSPSFNDAELLRVSLRVLAGK